MSPRFEIPSPEEDRPRWATVAAVAVISLAVGLGLAAWGTDEARGERAPDRAAGEGAADGPTEAPSEDGPDAVDPTGDDPDRAADVDPTNDAARETGPTEADPTEVEPTEAALAEADPTEIEPAEAEPTEAEPAEVEPIEAEAIEEPIEAAGESSGDRGALSGGYRIVPGQVAYLRCDGLAAPGRRCPRDEALERTVWAIVGRLAECPGRPRGPGQADLRMDFGAGPPELAWRDTFAPEVARLDEGATLACLRAPLATARQTVGASRLLVSFRFAVQ